MKPIFKETQDKKYIEAVGHYNDPVLCAKLTVLADLFAVESSNGYAKFNKEDGDKLGMIDSSLKFIDSTETSINIDSQSYTLVHSGSKWSGVIDTDFSFDQNNRVLYKGKKLIYNETAVLTTDDIQAGGAYTTVACTVAKKLKYGNSDEVIVKYAQKDSKGVDIDVSALTTAINGKQNTLTFDDAPNANSSNPVKSSGIYTALAEKTDDSSLAAVAKSGNASDITEDSTHRFTTDVEKAAWNGDVSNFIYIGQALKSGIYYFNHKATIEQVDKFLAQVPLTEATGQTGSNEIGSIFTLNNGYNGVYVIDLSKFGGTGYAIASVIVTLENNTPVFNVQAIHYISEKTDTNVGIVKYFYSSFNPSESGWQGNDYYYLENSETSNTITAILEHSSYEGQTNNTIKLMYQVGAFFSGAQAKVWEAIEALKPELKDLVGDATHRTVTDAEKTAWNGKQDALATQTAYTEKGTSTKVAKVTTNTLGQVTSIEEVDIAFPVTDVQVSGTSIVSDGAANIVTKTAYDASTNKIVTESDLPTVNSGTLTIQKNGTTVATFGANSDTDVTANIAVPVKTSDLTNDGNGGNNDPFAVQSFVNSSIATATATFRGTFNIVTDLGLTTSATDSQIATAIASKLSTLSVTADNNDYVFVAYPDATVSTHFTQYKRFKYSGSPLAWAYEYTLNNSSFTAAQWDAISSGITAALVAKIGTNENAITAIKDGTSIDSFGDVETALTGKLDKDTTVTTNAQVYTKNADGTQAMTDVAATVVNSAIVKRGSSGEIVVPEIPTADGQAASKKYVDTNGGKIDTVSVNGTAKTITNKDVNLTLSDFGVTFNDFVIE